MLEIEVSTEKIYLWPDSVDVMQPRYTNDAKTHVRGIARFPDGRLQELESAVDDRNAAFTRDVFAQYSTEEIEMFTHRANCQATKRAELETRVREDREASERREATFQAKAQAFAMPEVRDATNLELQRKIRQAKTPFEVMAWTTQLLAYSSVSSMQPKN